MVVVIMLPNIDIFVDIPLTKNRIPILNCGNLRHFYLLSYLRALAYTDFHHLSDQTVFPSALQCTS